MADTPEPDRAARTLAERVYSAYAQQAAGSIHPQQEQTLLARLAEAIRPALRSGEVTGAVNGALDAWERADGRAGGPRFARIDPGDGSLHLDRPA